MQIFNCQGSTSCQLRRNLHRWILILNIAIMWKSWQIYEKKSKLSQRSYGNMVHASLTLILINRGVYVLSENFTLVLCLFVSSLLFQFYKVLYIDEQGFLLFFIQLPLSPQQRITYDTIRILSKYISAILLTLLSNDCYKCKMQTSVKT